MRMDCTEADMNKLIKKLEKQSYITVEKKVKKGGWDNDRPPYEYTIVSETNFSAEKFAELIVRECIKSTLALQNTAIDNKWELDEAFHMVVDDIAAQFDMQHIFRVEK
jgi:hypothetical protein